MNLTYPRRIDDGQYHQVQVMRISSNASMSVDDSELVTVAGNSKYTVFNSQSTIEIGGQLDDTGDQQIITRPFKGKILGLKFNNMLILERARLNRSNVSKENFRSIRQFLLNPLHFFRLVFNHFL